MVWFYFYFIIFFLPGLMSFWLSGLLEETLLVMRKRLVCGRGEVLETTKGCQIFFSRALSVPGAKERSQESGWNTHYSTSLPPSLPLSFSSRDGTQVLCTCQVISVCLAVSTHIHNTLLRQGLCSLG